MIEKMKKYSFVLYHLDYRSFLERLQELGMLHIIRQTSEKTDELKQNSEMIKEYLECIRSLKKKVSDAPKPQSNLPAKTLLNNINKAFAEKENLLRTKETLVKQIWELSPWGHFDYQMLEKLRAGGIKVKFHQVPKSQFKDAWQKEHAVQIIGERSGTIYFIVLYTGEDPALEADGFGFHQESLKELEANLKATEARIEDIEAYFADNAAMAIETFEREIARLTTLYDFEDASLQGLSEADNHVIVLNGWIPISKEAALKEFIEREQVIHFAGEPTEADNPPVHLVNGRFAKLFEPISKMYMLPKYGEFDLTPFLAPFFMLFFGFCNADMAYGLIIVALGWFMKRKAKNEAMKGLLTLVMFFGAASVIMGFIFGSLLAYDMKELPGVGKMILVRDDNQIFNLALLLGVIQILFGIAIATAKKIYQSGFMHGVSSIGKFLFIAGVSVFGAGQLKVDVSAISSYASYSLLAGLVLIMLFNKPGKNPIINILGGLWEMYGIITGFFGDILSYIRLFALGVSSAILGFVINSVGGQMLGIPVAGPVIFFFFMILGHSINIALGGLSGFVHPLRLTFIEFFNNADFNGPGMEYKPLSKS